MAAVAISLIVGAVTLAVAAIWRSTYED